MTKPTHYTAKTIYTKIGHREMALQDIAREYGVPYGTVRQRFKSGQRGEQLTRPARKMKSPVRFTKRPTLTVVSEAFKRFITGAAA